jgi:hypothetical protein
MSYKPIPTKQQGVGNTRTDVQSFDERAVELLKQILIQIQLNNLYLSRLTGEYLDFEDLQEDPYGEI